MTVFINPGSGPVANATVEQARANVDAFVKDCGWDVAGIRAVDADDDGSDGRWSFDITPEGHAAIRVDMPGCDLDLVQQGTPWVSPRLYVDGSSWLWQYAVRAAQREDEDEATS